LSSAYLLENQLEKLGYTVEMQELTEAGPLYAGLAQGDVDMYPSAWPEVTHASYMEEYGDSIEDIGAYYEGAVLTIAVPDYVDITSIEDLKGNADMFGGEIVGIEPGAGLTGVTQDSMIPAYELGDEYTLLTSSTAAMLTELENAIAAEDDIVVTSWRPFWANDAYNLRDLEDPRGAMGEPEALHFLGTSDFSERFPEAAELIAGIQLDDAQYASLEDMVVNEYGQGQEAEAVEAWIEANPDAFSTLIAD
ncbi:glycine betaine ABC transporter substrate-binding protein, partial [Microbacterium aurantiacum]|uniref:glycine betaine ABC transporter substrate-binding protein n=1 Tax=Microbacterium aurantiacum TaxID=162393 RepID=UPI0040358567